jgi:hypothetical protein
MTGLSQHLLKSAGNENTLTMMSLLVPYALYQTAAIQLNLYKRSRNFAFKANTELIIEILTCMSKRWRAAGQYSFSPIKHTITYQKDSHSEIFDGIGV